MSRILGLIFLLQLVASAQAARTTVDLEAKRAYTSDAQGNLIQAALGESVYVTLEYRVIGPLDKQYTVKIQNPYASMSTPSLGFGIGAPGDYRVTWGPIPVLTDQPIRTTVSLIGVRGLQEISGRNNSATFEIIATRPTSGVEWYDSRSIEASMGLSVRWNQAPGVVQVFFPRIQTSSFQSVRSQSLPGLFDDGAAFTSTSDLGTALELSQESQISTQASSQRINRDVLMMANFEDYQLDSPADHSWLQPEIYVESNNSALIRFANTADQATLIKTPFSIAESVYKAVLARCSYAAPRPGSTPSALVCYQTKKGDCGALSALFVAGCRANGIPARTVAGFTEGENQWHVWAEFYVPGSGWIACDPAYAKGRMPKGNLPIYFGVMPGLNQRIATSFGFDVTAGGRTLGLLQSPSVFWSTAGIRALEGSSRAFLVSTPLNSN